MPLKRSAIIFLMTSYCAFLFCQPIQGIAYSREYPAMRNNIPLHIINNHPGVFYLLRYNKPGHEFVIERRSKPDARMLAFTPLKLDSVNASWFDYENLDYLLHECGNHICFVFEKVLNNRRAVYIKIVDTLGHSSGFKELATLERDEGSNEFNFFMKITGRNKLLLVGEQFYLNNTSKKVALLYDLEKNDIVWVKKLPLENDWTGFSRMFECNAHNDLYYVLEYCAITGYKRKYINNEQVSVPVLAYDSLFIACMPADARTVSRRKIGLRDSTGIKSISLMPDEQSVSVMVQGDRQNEAEDGQVFFMSQKFDRDLERAFPGVFTRLNEELTRKLTFYDGSDDKSPAAKDYEHAQLLRQDNRAFIIAGRVDDSYYKELLLWTPDPGNGTVYDQQVVPRKIFFMPGSARYKNIGEAACTIHNGNFYAFLLEHRNNRQAPATEFRFHRFSRQRSFSGGNLAAYILKPGGTFEKREVYRSIAYSFVPLKYQGTQDDFVFYLTNKGKKERFAILNLGFL